MSDASNIYFTYYVSKKSLLLLTLIGCAITGNIYSHIYPKESICHLNVVNFSNWTNHGEQVQFAIIVQQTTDSITFVITRVPQSLHNIT